MKNSLIVFTIFMTINVLSSIAQTPNWLWAKSAGGTCDYDEAYSVAVDASGNTYVTGRFSSPIITFDTIVLTIVGDYDIFIAKYDVNGNVLWAKSAGGTGNSFVNSVVLDSLGNAYVAGSFGGPTFTFDSITLSNNSSDNIFLAKYAPNGNVLWVKTARGMGVNDANSVVLDSFGNAYVTGWFVYSLNFGSVTLTNIDQMTGGSDLFLVKYDVNGNFLWAKRAGGMGGEHAYSVVVDASGNVYVAGEFTGSAIIGSTTLSNAGYKDIFLAKYDTNGNVLWVKSDGSIGDDIAHSVAVDASGYAYVAGGFTQGENIFLKKYHSSGNVIWTKKYGRGIAKSVTVDHLGNIYLTGHFSSAISFGSISLTSAGHYDIFLAKYDAVGNVLWAKSAGGTGYDIAHSVAVDASGNTYITGSFDGTTLVFGSITLTNTKNTYKDIFLAKLSNSTGINELSNLFYISVFPNPSSDKITIIIPKNALIEILNIQGQTIIQQPLQQGKTDIDISGLAKGVYILRLISNDKTAVTKFIKE